MAAAKKQPRQQAPKRKAGKEPVLTVHVSYRTRGEDPVADARWDALWEQLLTPLPDEELERTASHEDGKERARKHRRQQTA